MFLSELIAMQAQALLPIQGCSQTSTDVQAHNFYNTLANYSYNIKYNYTYTLWLASYVLRCYFIHEFINSFVESA